MTTPTHKQIEQKILAEFDEVFQFDNGLFNTESGWRMRADPTRIKSFLSRALLEAAQVAAEAGKLYKYKQFTAFEEGYNLAVSNSERQLEKHFGHGIMGAQALPHNQTQI